jgi:hypothetical protein
MKIKENFVLRQIAGTWAVLPIGDATLDFNGMLTLNESGVLLWQRLEQGCTREDLVAALLAEYEVTRPVAEVDVDEFLDKLIQAGCLEL